MSDSYIWLAVAVIALVTAMLRFLPFVVFGKGRKIPAIINKLGKKLPYSIMGMLVVYCLKDVKIGYIGGYLPAAIACLVVCVLYVWKRNMLVSIVAGTVSYMILVQMFW